MEHADLVGATLEIIKRGRELKEISRLFDFLDRRERPDKFIVTVSGLPGIGKSTLLDQIEDEAQKRGVPRYRYNAEGPDDRNDARAFAQRLFGSALPHLSIPDNATEGDMVAAVVSEMKEGLKNAPKLMLLDDFQYLSDVVRSFLERILIGLQYESSFLVIAASRKRHLFESFKLLRKNLRMTLEPLGKEDTGKTIPLHLKVEDKSAKIYSISKGYPIVIEKLCKRMSDASSETSIDQLKRLLDDDGEWNEWIDEIAKEVLYGYILKDSDSKDILASHIKLLSPLRRFEEVLFFRFSREMKDAGFIHDGNGFDFKDELDARAATKLLVDKTHTVSWNSAKMAYSVDFPLRKFMELQMRVKDGSRLLKIHEFAMGWYKIYLEEHKEKNSTSPLSVFYFVEYLYHYTNIHVLKTDEQTTLIKKIETELSRYCDYFDPRERNQLLEQIKEDDELLALFSPEDAEWLRQYLVTCCGTW